jgi:hypothetical protein
MSKTQVLVYEGYCVRLVATLPGRATALALAVGYLLLGRTVLIRSDGQDDLVLSVAGGQLICSQGL